jgi:hypothetical protein
MRELLEGGRPTRTSASGLKVRAVPVVVALLLAGGFSGCAAAQDVVRLSTAPAPPVTSSAPSSSVTRPQITDDRTSVATTQRALTTIATIGTTTPSATSAPTTTTTETSTTTPQTVPPPPPPTTPLPTSQPVDRSAATVVPVLSVEASCQAPDGFEADGSPVSFATSNMFDGDPRTAWRCPAPAIGTQISIRLAGPIHLTSVGLIPGYDKIDPTSNVDRFFENFRVKTVRWTFDNGSSLSQTFDDSRELQRLAVDVVTTNITITIDDVYDSSYPVGNPHRREFVPISEIQIVGVQ